MSSLLPPPAAPGLLRPRPELLCAKPQICCVEQGTSNISLYCRLVNNRGVLACCLVGGVCLVCMYVALFSWLQWEPSFGVIALLPALGCLYIFVVYRAMAPLEECLFDRDTHFCRVTTTGVCSARTTELEGVTHVQAAVVEFEVDGPTGPTGARGRGLQLHIHHGDGVFHSTTMWPEGEVKLRRAVHKINAFLETGYLLPSIASPRLADVVAVEPVPAATPRRRDGGQATKPFQQEGEGTQECADSPSTTTKKTFLSPTALPGPHHC